MIRLSKIIGGGKVEVNANSNGAVSQHSVRAGGLSGGETLDGSIDGLGKKKKSSKKATQREQGIYAQMVADFMANALFAKFGARRTGTLHLQPAPQIPLRKNMKTSVETFGTC